MGIVNSLGIGDKVTIGGNIHEIAWVLSTHNDSAIEFMDSAGIKVHWRPSNDGGIAQRVGAETVEKVKDTVHKYCRHMFKFYDHYTGRFIIPFEEVDYSISDCILYMLGHGWALSAYDDCGEKYYTVFSLRDDSSGWCHVNAMGVTFDILGRILKEKGYRYSPGVKLDYYKNSAEAQELVDYVLIKGYLNQYKGISIAVLKEYDSLMFIGVKDAFC